MLLREILDAKDKLVGYSAKCPACGYDHMFHITRKNRLHAIWKFDGDFDKPTFTPSMLVKVMNSSQHVKKICHSFIREGQWQFLNDCTHDSAGQTVPMIDLGS